ncbi:Elongation factor 1 alpha-like protein-like protein [Elsinoe fawcettii]|nr:Elongation factor 1 alpha-like protein-like protein [Elsinoe fawcettii]
MSGHRRVKNIDYDDADEYDDYEEEYDEAAPVANAGGEELTDEDKEQLRIGTAKVRSILGDPSHISNAVVEEALWHYYYDIEKTVTYLKNEHKPKEQRPKEMSRFDQAAAASAAKAPAVVNGKSLYFPHALRLGWNPFNCGECTNRNEFGNDIFAEATRDPISTMNPADVFKNVSWEAPTAPTGASFQPVNRMPRLYLLGGSGKTSKLAELAKRRKENLAMNKDQASDAVSLLDRLGNKPPTTGMPARSVAGQEQKPAPPVEKRTVISLSNRTKRQPSPPKSPAPEPTRSKEPLKDERPALPPASALSCESSTFAQTLGKHPRNSALPLDGHVFGHNMTIALFGTPDLPAQDDLLGPSPDAIVLQAQAKGKSSNQPAKAAKENKDTKQVTKGVENLNVGQTPPPPARVKSKNLNVAFEYANANPKKELNFVVVGHIDHGKSTLMGRLLYEHNVIDSRSLEKFRREAAKLGKESFHLAWVMDAREDEREHGVTIDYAEKSFSTPDTDFTIIDAPGHRDFVGNMIAGTSMADFALLVVDAGANSFAAGLKGQTREHAQVVRSHKLERIIVAVNKMDSVSWSSESFNDIVTQTTQFLSEQLFNPSEVVFVPVSGLTGDNVSSSANDKASWYTGPTLIQALDAIQPKREQYLGKITDPFRLRIAGFSGLSEWAEFLGPSGHEAFTAYGRVQAGNVQIGDRIMAQPSGEAAVVKGITKHAEPMDYAVPGQIVGLQLVECDEERFARGDLLCGIDKPVRPTKTATLKILAFDTVFPMPVDVHRGRMRESAVITQLVSRLDRETNRVVRNTPKRIKAGEVARVTVEFDEVIAIERMERVVLRYGGETVAAGAVEKIDG